MQWFRAAITVARPSLIAIIPEPSATDDADSPIFTEADCRPGRGILQDDFPPEVARFLDGHTQMVGAP